MFGSDRPGSFMYEVKAGLRRFWELPLFLRIGILFGAMVLLLIFVSTDGQNDKTSPVSGNRQPARTSAASLESLMRISDLSCGRGGGDRGDAWGKITNESTSTVQVFIDIQFLDGRGVILDDSIATVRGIRPGETAEWSAPYLAEKTYWKCRAQVSSAFSR